MSKGHKHHREHNKDYGREHRGVEKSNVWGEQTKYDAKHGEGHDSGHHGHHGHHHKSEFEGINKLDNPEYLKSLHVESKVESIDEDVSVINTANLEEVQINFDNFTSEGGPITSVVDADTAGEVAYNSVSQGVEGIGGVSNTLTDIHVKEGELNESLPTISDHNEVM